jgi:hypothetical protein
LSATAASIADHDRAHAGTVTVAAIAVAVTVPIAIAVTVTVAITVPEHAPITIAIIVIAEEAARLAEAVITKPAAYALDLLDDAQLVLRRRNTGRAGETDRVGTVGQQRGADQGCGGGQRHQQELVHFSSSSLSAVMAWKADSPTRKLPPIERPWFLQKQGPNRRQITLAARRTSVEGADASPGNTSPALTGERDASSLEDF